MHLVLNFDHRQLLTHADLFISITRETDLHAMGFAARVLSSFLSFLLFFFIDKLPTIQRPLPYYTKHILFSPFPRKFFCNTASIIFLFSFSFLFFHPSSSSSSSSSCDGRHALQKNPCPVLKRAQRHQTRQHHTVYFYFFLFFPPNIFSYIQESI